MRYIVVGGQPFYHHVNRGTTTFSALHCLGVFDDLAEAKRRLSNACDECGGLISIFDTETGLEVGVEEPSDPY